MMWQFQYAVGIQYNLCPTKIGICVFWVSPMDVADTVDTWCPKGVNGSKSGLLIPPNLHDK